MSTDIFNKSKLVWEMMLLNKQSSTRQLFINKFPTTHYSLTVICVLCYVLNISTCHCGSQLLATISSVTCASATCLILSQTH
jgi:hypothetical protein